jgi:TrmH family RNA methyltransferase
MFAKLSDVHMPQGILAVVKKPRWDERRVLSQSSLLGIFGERIQDPANVGTIIRTAAAFNLAALWLSPDSADVYSPKVVRSTSGTLLSLPIFRAKDVSELARSGCAIYVAEASNQGTVPIQDVGQTPRKLILAVGNESRGLSLAMRKAADLRFTIPLSHQVESLNVAATVAIAAFYFSRLPKEES